MVPFRSRVFALSIVALVALACVLAGMMLWGRRSVEAEEHDRLLQVARQVADNIARQIEGTNVVLERVRDEVLDSSAQVPAGGWLSERLALLASTMTGVRTLLVVDRSGKAVASSQPELVGLDLNSHERYAAISGMRDASMLYLSQPFRTQAGVWGTAVARVVQDARGQFSGFVIAILDPTYFEAILRSALYAPDMDAAVVHSSGKFVLQTPSSGTSLLDVGGDPNSAAMRHLRSGAPSTVVEAVTATGREPRLVASHNVRLGTARTDRFLVVCLSRDLESPYAMWRVRATVVATLFAGICLLTGLGLWMRQRNLVEHARSLDALEQTEERWRAALQASAEAVWDRDVERGTVLFSAAHEKMLGYSAQELADLGARGGSLVHPEDRTGQLQALDAHVQGRTNSYDGEFRFRHKAGHDIWIETHGLVIERTADGTPRRMVGTHRDISARKLIEQDLIAANRQLSRTQLALEDAGTAIYFVTVADGMFQSVNEGAARMLGYESTELQALSLAALDAEPCAAEKYAQAVRETQEHGHLRFDVQQRRRDGSLVEVQLSVCLLPPTPEVVMVVGVDITPRKAVERELRLATAAAQSASKAKSEFLASVSHEIRTPLNGLMGMLDLMRESDLDAEHRDCVNVALVAAKDLHTLLNDVLDLSKVEAGKLDFERIAFDVQAQLGNAVRAFAGNARAKNLLLDVEWHTPQRLLLGDPRRIGQVLNNLLDNAIKFTDSGGVKVRVLTTALQDGKDRCELQVSVADSGVGVPPEREQVIFDAFTQAEQSTSRRFGGTGLGLTLCRQLCERMGGAIQFERRAGGGSVFTFRVPCGVAQGPSPGIDATSCERTGGAPLQGRRVLVVDDNRVNQTLLQRWLTKEGMTVDVVGDGESGVRAVEKEAFDIVLMDISMPVMNGLDATRAIRALARPDMPQTRAYRQLPIVGVSANAMSGDREHCLESGMTDYVTKPIDRSDLLKKIANALEATT